MDQVSTTMRSVTRPRGDASGHRPDFEGAVANVEVWIAGFIAALVSVHDRGQPRFAVMMTIGHSSVLDSSLLSEQQIVGNARRSIIEVTGGQKCQLWC